MIKQCVLMRHGLTLHNNAPFGTCCYNFSNPATHTSYDIDPVHCGICIEQEENGQQSYRIGANQKYGLDHNHRAPIVLDLTPNRNCNLACKICDAHSSSTWAKIKQIPIDHSYNVSIKKFVEKLKDIDFKHVKEINFSGGEPLLNNNIVKYVSLMEDRIDFSQVTLRFSTNGTVKLNDAHSRFFQRFKLVLARHSLDDIGQRHEYQRYPSCWNQWEENWQYFLANMPHNVIASINRTVGILNIADLDLLNNWHQQYTVSRYGDPIELIDHFANGNYSLAHITGPLKNYVLNKCGESSTSWQYIKNRPVQTDTLQLKTTIQSQDKLHNQSLFQVDPDLYKVIFQ